MPKISKINNEHTTIAVSSDNHEKLTNIKRKLELEKSKNLKFDDVVKILIESYKDDEE